MLTHGTHVHLVVIIFATFVSGNYTPGFVVRFLIIGSDIKWMQCDGRAERE